MHHAVRVLAAIELGTPPFHAGIGRIEENRFIDGRRPLSSFSVKTSGLSTRPCRTSAGIGRIDLCDATMMALKASPSEHDDSVQLMQRREAYR